MFSVSPKMRLDAAAADPLAAQHQGTKRQNPADQGIRCNARAKRSWLGAAACRLSGDLRCSLYCMATRQKQGHVG